MVVCYTDCTRVYSVVEGMLMELGPLHAEDPEHVSVSGTGPRVGEWVVG